MVCGGDIFYRMSKSMGGWVEGSYNFCVFVPMKCHINVGCALIPFHLSLSFLFFV